MPTQFQFMLVGRIGPSGSPFAVGSSYLQTTNFSGNLYLAFNDGVNFNDNDGYWDVDVIVTVAPGRRLNILGSNTVAVCSTPAITGLVSGGGGTSLSQFACEDYFGVVAALGNEPTYRELMGLLLYTEFDTIKNNSTVYPLAREALARQYFEIAGSDGRFDSIQELFTFLGGIEGWYGHQPTTTVTGRYPLAWIIQVMRARAYVPNDSVPQTEFVTNIVVPAIVSAFNNARYVWNTSNWGGDDWTQGYGDCTQPARWGNVPTGTGNALARIPTPGVAGSDFIVQPPVGC